MPGQELPDLSVVAALWRRMVIPLLHFVRHMLNVARASCPSRGLEGRATL